MGGSGLVLAVAAKGGGAMNAAYVLTAILGAALVVATAAGSYFAFKTSRNTTLIQVYKGTADAWQERAAAYAVQIKELQTQNAGQAAELADLRGQVTMLKEMVTGGHSMSKMLEKVDRILGLLEAGQKGARGA
jgi:hypothetical protein